MSRNLLLAALALLLVGCGVPEPWRIGVVLNQDGVVAAQIAADEINRAGGVAGRRLEIVALADRFGASAEPAIQDAASLADRPSVLAVVGHSNSAASLAAAQVYNARGVPQIAPTSTSPLLRRSGPFTFRLVPDDVRQAEFLARQIAPGQRVAVAYVNDDYGRGLYRELAGRLSTMDVRVVYEGPFLEAGGARDDLLAHAIAAARPELLVWIGRAASLQAVLRTLSAAGAEMDVLASDAFENTVVFENPDGVFTGTRFVRFVDPRDASPAAGRFRAEFLRRRGAEMSAQAAFAYDAVHLIAAALRSGARTRTQVQEQLARVGDDLPAFEGIGGRVSFDPYRGVDRPFLLAEVTPSGVRPARVR